MLQTTTPVLINSPAWWFSCNGGEPWKEVRNWRIFYFASNKPLIFSCSFPNLISGADGRMLHCLRCAMELHTLYVNVHTTLVFVSAQIIKEPYILRTRIALIIFSMFFPQGGVDVLVLCVGTHNSREEAKEQVDLNQTLGQYRWLTYCLAILISSS